MADRTGKAEEMNGFTDLRLQAANDQIRRRQADAANERRARRSSTEPSSTTTSSIASRFGRSLRVLGLAH